MKLRNSCSIMENKLSFALYGKDWQLGFQCVISPDQEDLDIDMECVGRVPSEEQEYAFIWMDSCADVVVENGGYVTEMDVHAVFREMLAEGLNL